MDGKQATITGAATTIDDTDLTASLALVSNASGKVAVSSVTDTELGYVSGVTSGIQTQLDGKQATDSELAALAGLTSAADLGIQFTGSGTANTYNLTAAGKALLDDADATAQRTTLELEDMATQSSTSVSITGGAISGITDLAVSDGGTGASTTLAAKNNLGFYTGTAILPSGAGGTSVTVNDPNVTSSSFIIITALNNPSGTTVFFVDTIVDGVSFDITTTAGIFANTTFNYLIINP